MNPRRVHELMRQHFPKFDARSREWINVADRHGLDVARLSAMLDQYISSTEIVVEVHRKLGALLPRQEALAFVSEHLGEGDIRLADREFRSFVLVAMSGVAAGWRATANISSDPTGTGEPAPAVQLRRYPS